MKSAVTPPTIEVAFNADGAAEAGKRGRVVVVVDVTGTSTTAEGAEAAGAAAVFGASPAGAEVPIPLDPGAVGRRAAAAAGRVSTDVVVVVTDSGADEEEERRNLALPVLQALRTASVPYDLVPSPGAGLLQHVAKRVLVLVSATGGTAYDAAVAAGSPGVCFATTVGIEGRTDADVLDLGVRRAVRLAEQHDADLSLVAANADSNDDCQGAFDLARAIMATGFLKL
ncbi:MAG TPA: hypothetical protein VG602_03600 [Actinomycetota bacterium]|nr:hypothetical protein [Actinomycetota bacterium]